MKLQEWLASVYGLTSASQGLDAPWGQSTRHRGAASEEPETRGGRQREGMAQGLALVALWPLRQSHGP